MTAPQSLLALLGASWQSEVPVVALAWGAEDATVAFAQGDGHIAVARAQWIGGPRAERKEGGGVTIVPAEAPPEPPVRAQHHQGSCLCIAADAAGGFVTGGDDGRVVHLPRVGNPLVLAHEPGAWIDALACSRSGMRAFATGWRVQRVSAAAGAPDATDSATISTDTIELPFPATALAFSRDGRCLAAACSGGVTLWPDAGLPRRLSWHGYHRALAWSPDGRWLVTGMQENALHGWRVADGGDIEMGGYPGQPLSLSFSHDGRYLVTSGAMRPVCWGFDPPGADGDPTECGIAGKTPVTCVDCHPRQALIAAGYHNGAVVLCQPGSNDALFVKGAGGGAVNALGWSADGSRLAFGTQDGVFGWLGLPDALFRGRTAVESRSEELMR